MEDIPPMIPDEPLTPEGRAILSEPIPPWTLEMERAFRKVKIDPEPRTAPVRKYSVDKPDLSR